MNPLRKAVHLARTPLRATSAMIGTILPAQCPPFRFAMESREAHKWIPQTAPIRGYDFVRKASNPMMDMRTCSRTNSEAITEETINRDVEGQAAEKRVPGPIASQSTLVYMTKA